MKRLLLATGCTLATALVAAACGGDQVSDCFESNATRYSFYLHGDTTAVFHWPTSRMPVRIYAEPAGDLPATVDAAMGLWVNALRCGELTLQRTADSLHADIIFRNPAAMPPIPAPGVALAADSVGACTGRTDGLLDSAGTQLVGLIRSYVASNSIDPVAVASCYHFTVAHELGHALGLFNHSPFADDLMYVVPRRTMATLNDRYTIQRLYNTAATIRPPAP